MPGFFALAGVGGVALLATLTALYVWSLNRELNRLDERIEQLESNQ